MINAVAVAVVMIVVAVAVAVVVVVRVVTIAVVVAGDSVAIKEGGVVMMIFVRRVRKLNHPQESTCD